MKLDWLEEEVVVLWSDKFGYVVKNFLNCWEPVNIWFLMSFLKVAEKIFFDSFMLFHSLSLIILDVGDQIVHSTMNSGIVEELSILLPLL